MLSPLPLPRTRQRPSLEMVQGPVAPAPAPVAPKARKTRQINTTAHEGTIEVSRAIYHRGMPVGNPVESIETVRVPMFAGVPGKVRVEASVTRNLGDYNSVRVSVAIELPCYAEETEIRRAYTYGSDLVDEMVGNELYRATAPASEETPNGH